MKLRWKDTQEIACRLDERYPQVDPLSVRFTDLRQWVIHLDDFDDSALPPGESALEAIQMAWLECRREQI